MSVKPKNHYLINIVDTSTIQMKTRSNSNCIINYGLCSLDQSISIVIYACVVSQNLKLMTCLCSKIMQLLKGEPLNTLIADLHLIYILALYIHFYYVYRKAIQKKNRAGEGGCLEVSPLSKTLETRSLTAGESEIESLKSEKLCSLSASKPAHLPVLHYIPQPQSLTWLLIADRGSINGISNSMR